MKDSLVSRRSPRTCTRSTSTRNNDCETNGIKCAASSRRNSPKATNVSRRDSINCSRNNPPFITTTYVLDRARRRTVRHRHTVLFQKLQEQVRSCFAESKGNVQHLLNEEIPARLTTYSRECCINLAACLHKKAYENTNELAMDMHKQLVSRLSTHLAVNRRHLFRNRRC